MARTIRTKVFKFDELSEEAQQVAINKWRNDGIDTQYIYDEAHDTVKAFHEIFGTEEGRNSWLDVRTGDVDNYLMELKGLRLRTYIINNYWKYLFKGKYYKSWVTDQPVKHRKVRNEFISKANGWSNPDIMGKWYNRYYGLTEENDGCPLTGVCYDASLLQPMYEFLSWKLRPDYNSYMDFETLVNDCFASLRKDIDSEVDYRHTDEAIREDIEANEYEYTKDGKQFNS